MPDMIDLMSKGITAGKEKVRKALEGITGDMSVVANANVASPRTAAAAAGTASTSTGSSGGSSGSGSGSGGGSSGSSGSSGSNGNSKSSILYNAASSIGLI